MNARAHVLTRRASARRSSSPPPPLPPSPAPVPDGAGREREEARGGALLRAFLRLADRWGLGKREQGVLLGGVSRHTLGRWAEAVAGGGGLPLERDQRDRLACLVAIHKALRTIYPYDEVAYGWVRRPQEDFGGRTPLGVMLGGGLLDLVAVKAHLDDVLEGAG